MVCLPPAPLLCTAFGVWTDQPLCSVMPPSPGEQADEGGERWKEEQQNESPGSRERSATSFAAPVCLSSPELSISGKMEVGGAAASLDYICFIHVVGSHVILVHLHWSMASCCLGKGQAAPPPSSAATDVSSFLRMLISPDLRVFIPYMCIGMGPLLFPSFFAFHSLSPSLLCHAGGRLVQKRVNREPSGDIEEPNCLECARVSHTVIIRGTQQRPHGIYVPHCHSRSDPRDSLIINSNLNLTSNADPRDNIVVAISRRKSPLRMSPRSCFLSDSPLPSSPSHVPSITDTPAACRASERTPSCLPAFNGVWQTVKGIVNPKIRSTFT